MQRKRNKVLEEFRGVHWKQWAPDWLRGFRGLPEGSREDLERCMEKMIEQYRGYEIRVFWSNIEKGYVFCVFSMDGEGIMESGTYFYEENALLGAKETIDRIIQRKGK